MSISKIAITIDKSLLNRIDQLVRLKVFPNRSKAIDAAVKEKIQRYDKSRLARECALLDPHEEQDISELGISQEGAQWPHY